MRNDLKVDNSHVGIRENDDEDKGEISESGNSPTLTFIHSLLINNNAHFKCGYELSNSTYHIGVAITSVTTLHIVIINQSP